jgi:hypothetical protein
VAVGEAGGVLVSMPPPSQPPVGAEAGEVEVGAAVGEAGSAPGVPVSMTTPAEPPDGAAVGEVGAAVGVGVGGGGDRRPERSDSRRNAKG